MLAAAALSDQQKNQEQRDAHQKSYENTLNQINRTRAQQHHAQPYGFMVDDARNASYQADKAANLAHNNNIGAMLQAYALQNSGSGADDAAVFSGRHSAGQDFGGDNVIPGIQGGNLGGFDQNAVEGNGIGSDNWINPSDIGSTLEDDPWMVA